MKLGRSVYLATVVAISTWSLAACSKDSTAPTADAGPEGGNGGSSGSGGAGGKAGASGSSGSAGKAGASGSAGAAGTAGAAGSAGSTSVDAGNDGGDPSITITSPADGATITVPADDEDVPVSFKVANFALKDAGSPACPAGTCGHVHLLVDGTACNDATSTPTKPYNNFGFTSPINAGLDYCGANKVAGSHKITLELHNNDHSPVKLGTVTVSDSITITAVVSGGEGGGPAPEPDAGSTKDGG